MRKILTTSEAQRDIKYAIFITILRLIQIWGFIYDEHYDFLTRILQYNIYTDEMNVFWIFKMTIKTNLLTAVNKPKRHNSLLILSNI